MAGRGTDIVLGGNLKSELEQIDPADAGRARSGRGRLEEAPRSSRRGRRPAHRRHRAARVAAYRQPAARPFGPPGRPGLEPVLPVARRQPDAHLRRSRAHQALAADRRHEGRRGHREQDALAPDRARAAQGRGLQLRPAQEPARVRRRRQRPAQGRLPAAHRAHGGRGHRRLDHRHPRRGRRRHHRPVRAARKPRGGVEPRRPDARPSSAISRRAIDPKALARRRPRDDRSRAARAHRRRRSRRPTRRRSTRSARRSCGISRRP